LFFKIVSFPWRPFARLFIHSFPKSANWPVFDQEKTTGFMLQNQTIVTTDHAGQSISISLMTVWESFQIVVTFPAI